jgi:hypothetical protein
MTVLTRPLEHVCTHLVTEHWISAADDRWDCNVADCTCSRPRLIPERSPKPTCLESPSAAGR